MASEFGYTTVESVASRLRTTITSSSTPSTSDVESMISEQEAIINQHAGRRFDIYPVTQELYDHDGGSVITLAAPVFSITSLEYTDDHGDSWTVVPSTDYVLDSDYQRLERKVGGSSNTGSWPRVSGSRVVRVSYLAGYSSPPAHISALALDMSVLAVVRTLLNSQSNEEGGDIQVGPISIGESRLLNNPGYVRFVQDSITDRLSKLGGSRIWTSVKKNWYLN